MSKDTQYTACHACAYYLSAGDSSALDEDTVHAIDATIEAILRDDHGPDAHVMEVMEPFDSNYYDCLFCGDVCFSDSYHVTVSEPDREVSE